MQIPCINRFDDSSRDVCKYVQKYANGCKTMLKCAIGYKSLSKDSLLMAEIYLLVLRESPWNKESWFGRGYRISSSHIS